MWGGLAIALLVWGCAHAPKIPRAEVRSEPAWRSPDGRLEARVEMAGVLLASGRNEEALQVVAMARQEGGSGLPLDLIQARALHARGNLDEAFAILSSRLETEPNHAGLQATAGLITFDLGRKDEAEASFRKAVAFAPTDADVRNNLGFLLLVEGRAEEAVVELRECLKLDPSQDRARNNLGYALVALGRSDEALRTFRGVGTEGSSFASMGLAFERIGNSEQARSWYARALEREPQQPVALSRLAALAEGLPPSENSP